MTDEGLCRVGWSTDKATLDLGTDKFGYGFGGTGKKSWGKQFDTYGEVRSFYKQIKQHLYSRKDSKKRIHGHPIIFPICWYSRIDRMSWIKYSAVAVPCCKVGDQKVPLSYAAAVTCAPAATSTP